MDGKPLESDPAIAGLPVSVEPRESDAPAAPVAADYISAAEPTISQGGTPFEGSALSAEELDRLTADIIAALKTVYDPEIPSDIYELGLIYKIDVSDNHEVTIDMTLTAPGCPVAGEMPIWVENAVNTVAGISGTKVNIVFDPPWTQARMSDEAKLAVGMF
ncbi:MAG: SUF system Fe-S cluster assembly protein [Hyphomicrobium sp.]